LKRKSLNHKELEGARRTSNVRVSFV